MRPEDIEKTVSRWYVHIGAKGGRRMTDKQRQARRENAAKARAAREEKRKLGTGR